MTDPMKQVLLSFTYADTAKKGSYLATENKEEKNYPRQGNLASDPVFLTTALCCLQTGREAMHTFFLSCWQPGSPHTFVLCALELYINGIKWFLYAGV